MLRTVWFFVVMVASTIWYGTSVLVAGLMGVPRRDGGVYDRAAKRWARNALWAAGIPYRVVGVDHVPLGGPFVVASNHQSWFDIFLLAAVLPGSLRFVAKKELASVPLLGRAMRQAGHVFIDRQHRQAAFGAYDEAAAAIQAGISAVVFPEGTRSRTGELRPFKSGAFKLAIETKTPVVPLAITGTREALPRGSWVFRHRVHGTLTILPPVDTATLQVSDTNALTQDVFRSIQRIVTQSSDRDA